MAASIADNTFLENARLTTQCGVNKCLSMRIAFISPAPRRAAATRTAATAAKSATVTEPAATVTATAKTTAARLPAAAHQPKEKGDYASNQCPRQQSKHAPDDEAHDTTDDAGTEHATKDGAQNAAHHEDQNKTNEKKIVATR